MLMSPSHFTHRSQQRQATLGILQRLVGHARGSRGAHRLHQFPAGSEVKIGEESLPGTDHRPFARQRLLDLDDHVRASENLRRPGYQLRPSLPIILIRQARAQPGSRLEQDTVTGPHQLFDPDRQHRHTVLVPFHFLRNTYDHDPRLACKEW